MTLPEYFILASIHFFLEKIGCDLFILISYLCDHLSQIKLKFYFNPFFSLHIKYSKIIVENTFFFKFIFCE